MRFPLAALLLISPVWAQKPVFEAASIKLDRTLEGADMDTSPGLVRAQMTLRRYVAYAYDVRPYQVTGGPAWSDSDHFAIVAKLANASHDDETLLRNAMQQLLAERFQLKLHHELKEMPGYALTVVKGGLKIKEVPAGGDSGTSSHGSGKKRTLTATTVTMAGFATYLARQLSRPVADETHASGAYTFTLEWTPEELKTVSSSDEPEFPALFTALQEQLGLKLEARRSTPVDIIAVESAERPSEN
jgi:uncharacterized protein (TIGR03435 family)